VSLPVLVQIGQLVSSDEMPSCRAVSCATLSWPASCAGGLAAAPILTAQHASYAIFRDHCCSAAGEALLEHRGRVVHTNSAHRQAIAINFEVKVTPHERLPRVSCDFRLVYEQTTASVFFGWWLRGHGCSPVLSYPPLPPRALSHVDNTHAIECGPPAHAGSK
jgi:hypothetical protein